MKFINKEKGQALVEFAITLPLLLLIIMGILEFGMLLNSYLTIHNASREGARLGIIGGTDSEITECVLSVSPSLDKSRINISIVPGQSSRKSGDTITVTVSYAYNFTVPIISSLFNNSIGLSAQTSMRVE